MLINVMC